ncbi:hypothetical protein V8C26DRAFT_345128 [Trichoderma gracile]
MINSSLSISSRSTSSLPICLCLLACLPACLPLPQNALSSLCPASVCPSLLPPFFPNPSPPPACHIFPSRQLPLFVLLPPPHLASPLLSGLLSTNQAGPEHLQPSILPTIHSSSHPTTSIPPRLASPFTYTHASPSSSAAATTATTTDSTTSQRLPTGSASTTQELRSPVLSACSASSSLRPHLSASASDSIQVQLAGASPDLTQTAVGNQCLLSQGGSLFVPLGEPISASPSLQQASIYILELPSCCCPSRPYRR